MELSGNMIVYTANSTREATLVMEGGTYDAILSDYQMPEMDGIEFQSFLMSQGENVPFILFTEKGREEVFIRTLSCGTDFYLQKGK
ncbi:MAG: response regulator [Methanomassiliicoccus sp.]|nr:response regulator [Methanomassiliicoccus sp.]